MWDRHNIQLPMKTVTAATTCQKNEPPEHYMLRHIWLREQEWGDQEWEKKWKGLPLKSFSEKFLMKQYPNNIQENDHKLLNFKLKITRTFSAISTVSMGQQKFWCTGEGNRQTNSSLLPSCLSGQGWRDEEIKRQRMRRHLYSAQQFWDLEWNTHSHAHA